MGHRSFLIPVSLPSIAKTASLSTFRISQPTFTRLTVMATRLLNTCPIGRPKSRPIKTSRFSPIFPFLRRTGLSKRPKRTLTTIAAYMTRGQRSFAKSDF